MVYKRALKWVFSIAAFSFAPAVHADEGYDACMENASSSLDMSECAIAWNKRAEALLAKAWRAAMDEVGGKNSVAGKELLEEQRAWIKFKDLSCGFYYGDGFGSMHRSIHAPKCRNIIIEDRARQLSAIAKDQS
jgi:uncharacterized protein YecT (DUF1311 family)